MGNDNKDNMSNLDDEKQPATPAVEPDQDLQSYEEKGFTPEKDDDNK